MKRFKKYKDLLIQFVKFGMVGLSNTFISLAVYYILVYFRIHYLLANACGFVISVINAFYWNNKYVFKDKTETSIVRAFLKVFASYGGSFCISTGLIFVMVNLLGISEWLAPLLRLVVTVPINFLLNKLWAFRKKGEYNENTSC